MIDFIEALEHLENEMTIVGQLDYRNHALFGSASLKFRGLLDREPGDIDVFVTKKLWGLLLPRHGWEVLTPKRDDPPILASKTKTPVHLFYAWSDENVDMDVFMLLRQAEWKTWRSFDFRCISPEEALRHKEQALLYGSDTMKMQKHIPDIQMIKERLLHESAAV